MGSSVTHRGSPLPLPSLEHRHDTAASGTDGTEAAPGHRLPIRVINLKSHCPRPSITMTKAPPLLSHMQLGCLTGAKPQTFTAKKMKLVPQEPLPFN